MASAVLLCVSLRGRHGKKESVVLWYFSSKCPLWSLSVVLQHPNQDRSDGLTVDGLWEGDMKIFAEQKTYITSQKAPEPEGD